MSYVDSPDRDSPDPDSPDRDAADTVLVVDAANVVGSVPDGWWRDRRGATERLRDRLAPLATTGLPGLSAPLRVVLVCEGRARGVTSIVPVSIVDAPGSGDDTIVDVVTRYRFRHVVVVTADRELRRRVKDLGADTLGPSALPPTITAN
ncbi:hypothetical protein ACLQ3C_00325 [Gordonia sp. DT30]|uniref:hypothetical protein n=1 Tax=unclassified Gordonia (in: high G+C Gram-positive bacteria) TaxID=2657482 RepID=UPI003CF94F8D